MATCQSCYKRVPEGASHCPHCGAAQPQPETKKTVFGYAATDQLPQLAETQTEAPPDAPEAMAKTMFAGSGSSRPSATQAPAPKQKPSVKAPKVRMPQVDPSLRRPLRDPTSPKPAVASEAEARPPSQPSVVPPKVNAVPPTVAAPSPAPRAVPPTMAATTPAPRAVPPTMAAPTPAPQAAPPTAAMPRPASAPARVNRASTTLYMVFILGGVLLTGGLTGLAVANLSHMHELLYFSWMPAILTGIFFLVLIYKAWAAIQDGQTPVTPGKAVGFLFIPFFNIYWIFVGIGGWAKQYNAYLERHSISAPRASEGLFIAYPVCCLVPLAAPVALVLLVLVVAKMCNGINTIAGAQS